MVDRHISDIQVSVIHMFMGGTMHGKQQVVCNWDITPCQVPFDQASFSASAISKHVRIGTYCVPDYRPGTWCVMCGSAGMQDGNTQEGM